MKRGEQTPVVLTETYLKQVCEVGDMDTAIRLKWILHRELSVQMDSDEMVLLATIQKNKTL